jgi:outer membrane protein OmpA-like peptidoglycan-associated protein
MTSRSIVLGTAALLLLSAATPLHLGFAPTAAVAQEVSQELKAALTADPNQLEPRQLSEYIRVMRDAVKSGAFSKSDKKAVQQRIKHYQAVLAQHRDQRQQAGQDDQRAEEQQQRAQQGEPERDQQSERQAKQEALKAKLQAEKQAEKAAREAEKQAEKAAREVEKSPRQAEKAERKAQQQASPQQPAQQPQPDPEAGLTPEMIAALRDDRPASALEPAELRNRIQVLRSAVQSGALSREQRAQVQARRQADIEVLQARRAERKGDVATEQPAPQQAAPEQTREKQPREARTEKMPEAEVEQRARSIIADKRPAAELDEQALRKRLSDNRAILETSQLSKSEVRELRQQLRQDREELRSRVAIQQEKQEKQEKQETTAQKPSRAGGAIDSRDVSRIIEQRMASDQLTDRELEERVRILSRALKAGNITVREAEVARLLIDRDRSELRRRLHAGRDRRRERRQHSRSRNEIIIDFNLGYRPPPVIFAAEAMPRDIEMQLVAPPIRRVSRPYSFREIAANHDIRETMPGIEIDTLNFDFGSAEVRPEEIDKLDAIAEVIERIVEERPDEVFLIEGHTDAVGSDAANDALSQRRAEAVVEALLDYYAIYPENLQTVGLGERYLKIWTEEPEEENRRVTIRRITPLLAGGQG